jgi:hypothetical protein
LIGSDIEQSLIVDERTPSLHLDVIGSNKSYNSRIEIAFEFTTHSMASITKLLLGNLQGFPRHGFAIHR